ncbi:MAG: hypothetical protein H6635_09800 [Anaerolineales bacterium]|nr:hypothetical protein [Anaerolineales bacterium]MCB9145652.1 hypothetical protein [Anaerolineales bacterium]
MKKLRMILAVIVLAVSLALLIWGYAPNPHEMRIQTISPTEMQLPTPSSLHPEPEAVS